MPSTGRTIQSRVFAIRILGAKLKHVAPPRCNHLCSRRCWIMGDLRVPILASETPSSTHIKRHHSAKHVIGGPSCDPGHSCSFNRPPSGNGPKAEPPFTACQPSCPDLAFPRSVDREDQAWAPQHAHGYMSGNLHVLGWPKSLWPPPSAAISGSATS